MTYHWTHTLLHVGFLTSIAFARLTLCPDNWTAFRGSCYLFGTETPMTFFEAEHFCRQHGGHLVHVDSADENAFLKNRIRTCKGSSYWMGLTDESIEGTWIWYDTHTKPNFTDWGTGQPNDLGHHEDCAEFDSRIESDFTWNDASCSGLDEPLCEISEAQAEIVG